LKRHRALVPLSHDHHHALVEARRLRRAADGEDPAATASAFLRFFAEESVRHFREEEELLFPLVAEVEEARELVVAALLQHQRLHALAARLRRSPGDESVARDLGELLEAHVRLEERELFPLIERIVGDGLELRPEVERPSGPLWGTASADLNATLLAWPPGHAVAEHVNAERDVLLVVLEGSCTLVVDGEEQQLGAGEPVVIEQGRRRAIVAGAEGVRYLSVHRRRPPLRIEPRST
jgi:mannose-6-phosphate isomerase-like protein (cupin superfamily)